MIKILQMSVLIFLAFIMTAKSVTVSDSVALGNKYQNEVWYNLSTGVVKSSDHNNWDIAFQTSFGAGVHVNGAKGLSVWVVPDKTVEDFKTFSSKDTVGMAGSWKYYLNSEDSWNIGAFNLGLDGFANDDGDYGWGQYDMGSHFTVGTKLFVVKLNNTTYKKFYVEALAGEEFSFVYANLDGTDEALGKVAKKSFKGKNFGYFALDKAEPVDREPLSVDWHLVFGKYVMNYPTGDGGFMPYTVTGVRHNLGFRVAKVTGVAPETAEPIEWVEENYVRKITTIGSDWKTFNMAGGTYDIKQDWVYFLSNDSIQNMKPQIYRLYFTGFEGSATGLIKFQKEAIPTSVIEKDGQKLADFSIYPSIINKGENITLAVNNFSSLSIAKIEILSLDGRSMNTFDVNLSNSMIAFETNNLNLSAGMYFVKVTIDNKSGIEKLIVK